MSTDVTPTDRPEYTVKLSVPIPTHQGPKSELTFRSPSARVFLKHGAPYRTFTKGTGADAMTFGEYNFDAVFHFAAEATGVEEIHLKMISADDMMALAAGVMYVTNPTLRKIMAA